MNNSLPRSEPQRLITLVTRNFRNLAANEIAPGKRFNVFFGGNGQGKSNILEAIDYFGTLRSFRGGRTDDLIFSDKTAAEIVIYVSNEGEIQHEYKIQLRRGEKRIYLIDGKRQRSRAHFFRSIHMVLFHPGDLQFVSGPSDLRRAFIDRILEQFDQTYASTLVDYLKALKSRNRLLRDDHVNQSAIKAFDEILKSAGAVVGQTRAKLISELSPRVERAYLEICGGKNPIRLSYQPRVEPTMDAIGKALDSSLKKDLARGFTTEGPHRDDLLLELNKTPAKHFASQGQHRAIVLALKIAELHELERRVGNVPILLLDDVSSELDRDCNRRLFSMLAQMGGQVFLTTTHREFILIDTDRDDFLVQDGVVSKR